MYDHIVMPDGTVYSRKIYNDCNENYQPIKETTMSKTEQDSSLTTKQIAQGAVIAYIAVKTTKALSATVVNTIHFRRARKANKTQK